MIPSRTRLLAPDHHEENVRDEAWHALSAPRPDARVRAPWHDGAVSAIDVSRDGAVAVSTAADGRVRVWDLRTGELRWQFERPARRVLLAPDARLAYAITDSFEVWALDLGAGIELDRVWAPARRGLNNPRPDRASLSPDGRWLLATCGGDDGDVRVVDLVRGAVSELRAPGAGELYPVGSFDEVGRAVRLLGGVREGRSGRHRPALYRFSLDDGAPEEIRALRFSRSNVSVAAALHRERCVFAGRWLVVIDAAGQLALRWDVTLNDPVRWIPVGVDRVERLVVSERVFAVSFARDRAVAVIDQASAELVSTCPLPVGEAVTSLAFMGDGATLLAGSTSGRVLALTVSSAGLRPALAEER